MKTPTVDDPKPKRENLGPTGPAKVSHDEEDKDVRPPGGPSYESELEHILDKTPRCPPISGVSVELLARTLKSRAITRSKYLGFACTMICQAQP